MRNLPGCRPHGLSWDECKLDLLESDTGRGLVIGFRWTGVEGKRELVKKNGRLQCNLQELQVLRWIAEEDPDNKAAHRLADCNIEYLPQKRYDCLFPHQCRTAHKVLEMVSGMTAMELKEIGEEAVQHSAALLCPIPDSRCTDPSHTHFTEEVEDLARYWPARQVVCDAPVEGMIDVVPVALCRNDPARGRCSLLVTRAHKVKMPTEIRACNPPLNLAMQMGRILDPDRADRVNPDFALHSSWHGDISYAIQDPVLQCQHREATGRPTRLFDVSNSTVQVGIQPSHYLALSYCWDEWPSDETLKKKLYTLYERLAIRYFWVDKFCIDQKDNADKTREIPRMRSYYEGASGCVVLTGPTAKSFQCLPQHQGAILSAYQQIRQNFEAMRSIFNSKWTTRVWTLQEALLSRQVIYVVEDQLVDGDYVSELAAFIQTFSEIYIVRDERGHNEWIGGSGSYRWNATNVTCVYPRQFRVQKNSRGFQQLNVIRSIFGGQRQYEVLEGAGQIAMPFEEALSMVVSRDSKVPEDCVYGLLGICVRGDQIKIEPGISWERMLEKLASAGMITERQLASTSVNELPHMTWLPQCGSGSRTYGPFHSFERLSGLVQRPRLTWLEQRVQVLGAIFEWHEYELEAWDVFNIHGLNCNIVRGIIRFPDTPGVLAKVVGTSSSSFTDERMLGTHVMLCQDVDEETVDTVAINISGNIGDGYVRRNDGYVLELYSWEGDPRSLKARNWNLGSPSHVGL